MPTSLPRAAAAAALAAAAIVLSACAGTAPDATPTGDMAPTPEPTPSASAEPNPAAVAFAEAVERAEFYLGTGGQSGAEYRAALVADDPNADLYARIALTPQAEWFGAWTPAATVATQVDALLDAADEQGKPAVLVVYAIPGLDCSYFAEGGLEADTYIAWVDTVASAIDGREPWVILEPDALGQLGDCDGQDGRVGMLADAAALLDDAGARVYLDAGNAEWLDSDEAARRIELVGTTHLAGFALNVSNYVATDVSVAYGEQVRAITGLPFVVDTSRNGNGWNGEWCNARDRALGEEPRIVEDGGLDAVLWVKRPGESDGPCNGGPAAGTFWPEIALEMARNAG